MPLKRGHYVKEGVKFNHSAKGSPIAWGLLIQGNNKRAHVLKLYVHLKGGRIWRLFETKSSWIVGELYEYARSVYADITVMEVDE